MPRCATFSQSLHFHKNTKCPGPKSWETRHLHLHKLMLGFPPPRGKRALASTSLTFHPRLPQISLKRALFFGALFDGITESAAEAATEAKNAIMVPINSIDGQITIIKNHVNTAQRHMDSISKAFGRRRLLSEEEVAEHHHKLRQHAEALAASIAHADFVYKSHMQRIEDRVLLGLECDPL